MVRSVDKALEIINLFSEESYLGLNEIAKKMNSPKSTTHGLISSLKKYGYIEKNAESNKYCLGIKFLEMAQFVKKRLDLRRIAFPIMQKLMEEYGEAVHLSVLDRQNVVYIERIESCYFLKFGTPIGSTLPANCTATGKIMLAHLPEEAIDKIYGDGPLPSLTPHSISNLMALKKHLKDIFQLGYAVDNEECELGLRGVAAPIRNYNGKVIAAISMGGSVVRVTLEKIPELAMAVKEAAVFISKKLGCP